MIDTFTALKEYIVPNYSKLKKQYSGIGIYINTKYGYIEVKCHKKTYKVFIIEEKDMKYYKILNYKDSYFTTQAKPDYSGFDTILFAIWELHNPILQVKDSKIYS